MDTILDGNLNKERSMNAAEPIIGCNGELLGLGMTPGDQSRDGAVNRMGDSRDDNGDRINAALAAVVQEIYRSASDFANTSALFDGEMLGRQCLRKIEPGCELRQLVLIPSTAYMGQGMEGQLREGIKRALIGFGAPDTEIQTSALWEMVAQCPREHGAILLCLTRRDGRRQPARSGPVAAVFENAS